MGLAWHDFDCFPNLRLTFGDADDERDLVLDGFDYGIGRKRRGHVDNGSVRIGLPYSLSIDPKMNRQLQRPEITSITSLTSPNTGKPRWVDPAFLGDTPPTVGKNTFNHL
jgi:hypothetical protein